MLRIVSIVCAHPIGTIALVATLLLSRGSGAFAQSAASAAPTDKASATFTFAPDDWPWWRGPTRDGVAAKDARLPLKWSTDEGVVWKTPVAGRGHGSPIVVGGAVYLAVADYDQQVQSLLALDRHTGERLWQAEAHKGGLDIKGNDKSSLASSTPACDGERVIINFLNGGAIYTTAFDLTGQRLWQTKVGDFVIHQGFGSSPAVYGSLVIVSADHKGGGALAALDRATGAVVWRRERPKTPNYTSPIILNVAGRDQLLFTGCDLVTSLNPLTGDALWEIPGSTTECVTSTVTDGRHIYTSGGYPKNHLAAVAADGTGKVAWENGTRVYVPSMIVRDGYLYAMLDAGIAACFKSDTGAEQWQERLGGTFSASLTLAGDKLLAIDESGRAITYRASPKKYEQLAENQLGDEVFATPTLAGDRLYLRVAEQVDGKRQEWLYCVGSAGDGK